MQNAAALVDDYDRKHPLSLEELKLKAAMGHTQPDDRRCYQMLGHDVTGL